MSIDTSYIQNNVASVLAEGLKETINSPPFDPVDYLAKWLLHYRDVQDNLSDFNSDQLMLQEKKQEYLEVLQKEKERLDEEERLKEEEKRKALEKKKKAKSQNSNEEEEESQDTEAEENHPQPEENTESTIYSSSYD